MTKSNIRGDSAAYDKMGGFKSAALTIRFGRWRFGDVTQGGGKYTRVWQIGAGRASFRHVIERAEPPLRTGNIVDSSPTTL